MEIIFASTGVECVAAPSKGVIFLDPTLDYESAVDAISASLPGVHIDAIRHWVEKAMPSSPSLRRHIERERKVKRRSRFRAFVASVALLAVGAGGMWAGLWAKHKYGDNVFARPVFAEMVRDRGWSCARGLDMPMSETCTTRDGLTLRVTATISERVVAYTIGYDRSGVGHMNRLVVFPSSLYLQGWLKLEGVRSDDGLHPNLVTGTRWALYGNDEEKIRVWASVLPQAGDDDD